MLSRVSAKPVIWAARATTHGYARRTTALLALLAATSLSACASFSPDAGFAVVSDVSAAVDGKEAAFLRSPDDAARAEAMVRKLLARPLTADAAVQVALLNNKDLQAAYNELALADADRVEQGLPPNPTFSLSRIAGDGASEIERQVVGDVLALATLPLRNDIARERFHKAQLKAALATLRLAAEVRGVYVDAVAANETAALLRDATATAEAATQLAKKLGETGALNKLDLAREQVFSAETTTELAAVKLQAARARERLTRLLGLWGADPAFRLPDKLPALPRHPQPLPDAEVEAVTHRIDLQMARIELAALAISLDLTQATRFVTLLDVAGIDRRTRDPDGAPFRERGFDVQFQIPIFDGGEVRVRQATESYNQAFNRLTAQAVNVRSEAREAYAAYRSTYDIASRYQRDVLPLRRIITEEMQLRYSSMQIDVFALVTEARQRLASLRAAVDAKRDFFLAQSDLRSAVNGGGAREPTTTAETAGTH